MRIVVDLDGVICSIKQPGESYMDVKVTPGAPEMLRELRQSGHYIIIQTARNMATCDANLGRVMKNVGKITLDWLEKHGIEYDEIFFGKPNGEIYIDDRGLRFEGWEYIKEELLYNVARER